MNTPVSQWVERDFLADASEREAKMVSKNLTLSVRCQCKLLTLTRSNLYYKPKGGSVENRRFMEIIDEQFLEAPWYGSRQMAVL
ncbi:MAG: hypothetical protein ACJA1F_001292 [Paracoccaceae bacterium]